MGILGEIPRAEMIKKLQGKWLNGRQDSRQQSLLYIILQ
jgi:hypothetical protein